MCACLGLDAAIVGPAGFPVSDRHFRRAGMDYLEHVRLARYASFEEFDAWRRSAGRRLIALSTKAQASYLDCAYRPGDILMVGRESAGLPEPVFAAAALSVAIPMREGLRSLNVAVAAAMIVGEALRQVGQIANSE